MTNSQPVTRRELESKIISKVRQDPSFKERLLHNPSATIVNELGAAYLSAGPKFQVLEETPDVLYLVLPMDQADAAALSGAGGPLSDEEMKSLLESDPIVKCSRSGHPG